MNGIVRPIFNENVRFVGPMNSTQDPLVCTTPLIFYVNSAQVDEKWTVNGLKSQKQRQVKKKRKKKEKENAKTQT